MVGTRCFHCKGYRFSPWSGAKILCTTWHSQKRKAKDNKKKIKDKEEIAFEW